MHTPEPPTGAGGPSGALGVYSRAIRRHWQVVAGVVLAALLGGILWTATRSPSYEATAQVYVTPLAADDPSYFGLPVLRDSGDDPTRVLKTASKILRSPEAARRAAELMGPGWTGKRVLDHVDVSPEAQSSILNVTASDGSAGGSARLANNFTKATLQVRADKLRQAIEARLAVLTRRQQTFRQQGSSAPADLSASINQLEAIRGSDDPTLSLNQAASVPTSPAGVSTPIVLALALLAGLTLGVGAAVLLELLNRRIRDEEEATDLYPLPVLARVPIIPRRARQSLNGAAWVIPPPVHEAFRTVLVQLTWNGSKEGETIMVTSASTGDGKTTSSINLAVSIAATGRSVVLIDFDIRKPDIARALGLPSEQPIVSLVSSQNSGEGISKLLTAVPGLPNLSVLAPARMPDGAIGLIEALHQALPSIIRDAKRQADYVIIDTAPLGEVSDGLRVASVVDRILVVTRPGQTNRVNFEVMRDLLMRTQRPVAGLLVIGETQGASNRYYDYTMGVRRGSLPGGKRRALLRR